MIFKNRRITTKNLSPQDAWDKFVDMNEEKFIAFMRPATDIGEICKIYASDLPKAFEYEKILFTNKQIKEIERLLCIYLTDFVNSKGGYKKLDLMTEEEIEDYFDQKFEKSLEYMASYFDCTPEEIYQAIDILDEDED
ncbi:MAG TPA: hypothetical protein VK071_11045 [Tissierellales bacterium]|nr:hypothetical protein [Tissierellales bacterium]